MGNPAEDWRASAKLVLLVLAERASRENGWRCWPSVADICEQTELNRKTVIAALAKLRASGLVSDTQRKVGKTGQIAVLRINYEQSQKRVAFGSAVHVGAGTETVPFFPPNSPVFSSKESQKRDTEPVKEPVKEPVTKNICADGAPVDGESLPAWLNQDLWATYVGHYHDLQAMRGMSVPTAWEAKALRILSGLLDDGYDQEQVIEQAINSRDGLLLPVSRHQPKGATSMCKTKFPTMRAAGWRFVGQPVNRPRPTVLIFH